MKRIILVFGLVLTGLALFGQSPRIRLNQITKDSLTGSVVLSGSDSNMVYSRDFFLNFQDSVLIVFGDTLSTTATAFTGVATDLTLTGNGTVGNELKVDTAIIATVSALADSLAGIISSVTTDLTLTGDGSVATPLKVDTSVIATIRALSDSLATLSFATNQDISDSLATLSFASLQDITDTLDLNTRDYITGLRLTDTLNTNSRGFLTQNQTITLTDDATGSGATSISVTVVDDSHNHTISTLTGIQDSLNSKAALVHTHTISDVAFLQDSLDVKANDSDLNNYLLTSNYIVDSTRINATGDTAYYYQNGVLIGTGAIAGGGGGGSGTVTDITAGTFLSGGTITTSGTIALDTASAALKTYISENIGTVDLASEVTGTLPVANGGTGATTLTSGAFLKGNGTSAISGSSNLTETADTVYVAKFLNVDTSTLYVDAVNNRVGIGTSSPISPLDLTYSSGFNGFNIESNQNGVHGMVLRNNDTGTAARTGITFYNGSGAGDYFGFYINGNNYTGVSGWADRFTVQSGTGVTNGLLFYSDQGGIQLSANGTNTPDLYVQDATGNIFMQNLDDTTGVSANMYYNTTSKELMYITSSQRYKTDIKDYDKGLDFILNLRPVYYRSKKSSDLSKFGVGFIAEEVEEIGLSEFIDYDANGLPNSVHYSLITALTTKAIQEQQAIIESQQQEIETLKTQYNDLLQRIINLENK